MITSDDLKRLKEKPSREDRLAKLAFRMAQEAKPKIEEYMRGRDFVMSAEVAQALGIHLRVVQRALKGLVEDGVVIHRVHRGGKGSGRRFVWELK